MFIKSFHSHWIIFSVTALVLASCKTDDTRTLAEKGDPTAQYELGVMYQNGEGLPQNYSKAVKWFRMAAEQGNTTAQLSLARMYDRGNGVPQNDLSAYMWANLAASGGLEKAETFSDILRQKITKKQIAEAERLSKEWVKKRAKKQ
ncbi:sel1 repeat family protein [bacterium]|nr:sel1 repeat family protein [bacterium]